MRINAETDPESFFEMQKKTTNNTTIPSCAHPPIYQRAMGPTNTYKKSMLLLPAKNTRFMWGKPRRGSPSWAPKLERGLARETASAWVRKSARVRGGPYRPRAGGKPLLSRCGGNDAFQTRDLSGITPTPALRGGDDGASLTSFSMIVQI